MSTKTSWQTKTFAELDVHTLYAILRRRQEIFCVEQECVYLDLDGLDQAAHHMMLFEEGQLIAYQRCLPPGTPYAESSLGRILVPRAGRGRGLGRELVQRGIDFNFRTWPDTAIRIGAQARLQRMYEALGFCACGNVYLEDGIEHIHMLLQPAAPA